MNIGIIGGGPAGLYFAILMRKAFPGHTVTVYERNASDDTFGWGVVFSDATLENLAEADAESYTEIGATFAKWDEVHVRYRGEVIRSRGHGFCGIERRRLLEILQARARDLGADLRFRTEIADETALRDCDLVIAADGINSRIRSRHAGHFRPSIDARRCKYIWLGSTRPFDAFTFLLRASEHGFFTVHAYQFDAEKSTFIVECDEASWRNAGLDRTSAEEGVAWLEALFAEELEGHRLLMNRSEWINFRTVRNERWYSGNVVLMGDAAHTAHFSIGSGTKLAMEDAICLARTLREHDDLPRALAAYEAERKWFSERLQRAAQDSLVWFEEIHRRRDYEPRRLAYGLLTRSRRLQHHHLGSRDGPYVREVNRWFAADAGLPERDPAPPPMFTPYRLRGLTLANRVVCSPMCMYRAVEGVVNDWHLVHLGSRAVGGAGLILAEMTAVSPEGRITPGCAGLYRPDHAAAWRRVVDFVHAESPARIGIQLGHAGRKGSTRLPWEGLGPLPEGGWAVPAPSALPFMPGWPEPRAVDRAEMERLRDAYAAAAQRALEAGFDMLELHMAHGYLLASFLSPLTNLRKDAWGGSLENRMRYPLEVFDAVRAAWPDDRPISVRISAVDWIEGGQTIEDSIVLARALRERGCDIVDVSSGHTTPESEPPYGRGYQLGLSERIRHEAGVPTMAVGGIGSHGLVNAALAAGQADLCALARPHLFDPYLTLHAAAEQEHHDVAWPDPYLAVRPQPRERLPWLER